MMGWFCVANEASRKADVDWNVVSFLQRSLTKFCC
jgi:hypothetical protein